MSTFRSERPMIPSTPCFKITVCGSSVTMVKEICDKATIFHNSNIIEETESSFEQRQCSKKLPMRFFTRSTFIPVTYVPTILSVGTQDVQHPQEQNPCYEPVSAKSLFLDQFYNLWRKIANRVMIFFIPAKI